MEQPRDEKLWKIAQRRATFRRHLYSYIFVNAFLWAIWWFTSGYRGDFGFPWPLWVMIGWGFGLAREYYLAFGTDDEGLVEKEYQKLTRKQQ